MVQAGDPGTLSVPAASTLASIEHCLELRVTDKLWLRWSRFLSLVFSFKTGVRQRVVYVRAANSSIACAVPGSIHPQSLGCATMLHRQCVVCDSAWCTCVWRPPRSSPAPGLDLITQNRFLPSFSFSFLVICGLSRKIFSAWI